MFYDYELNKMLLEKEMDELYQEIETYEVDYMFLADVQPSNDKINYKTFGETSEADFIIYADELLELGDVVEHKDRLFRVENRTCWDDYNVYGIKEIEYDNGR